MGTDNLFHKRKAKSAKGLQRRAAKRDAYAKVLIVCEGEKTEPHYFHGLRNYYGLNTANVEVCGESGSDPNSVVRFAKQRFREEKDAGDACRRRVAWVPESTFSARRCRIHSVTPPSAATQSHEAASSL